MTVGGLISTSYHQQSLTAQGRRSVPSGGCLGRPPGSWAAHVADDAKGVRDAVFSSYQS